MNNEAMRLLADIDSLPPFNSFFSELQKEEEIERNIGKDEPSIYEELNIILSI